MKCLFKTRHASSLALVCFALIASQSTTSQADIVDFEKLTQFSGTSGDADGQPGGSYYNGDAGKGSNSLGWTSGSVYFNNSYTETETYSYWSGWSYSNVINTVTSGFTNEYASSTGGGALVNGEVDAGGLYAVASGFGAYFNLPEQVSLQSVQVTNNTYAMLSMEEGDLFAKPFGGPTGDDPDYFRVDFVGYSDIDTSGSEVGRVTVDLADFTFDDNSLDYILDEWLTVDLSAISGARSVGLEFASSDVGDFGINTPLYVAIDNLSYAAVPEANSQVVISVLSCLCVLGLIWKRRTQLAMSRTSNAD